MNFEKYLQALIGAEMAVFPLFFHSDEGLKLRALIVGTEVAVLGTVAAAQQPPAPVEPPK